MVTKLILLSCFIAVVLAMEKYTTKFDNIDIQEILDNKRLLSSYSNCVLDRGKCTAAGKELKEHIQDALETGCEKCSDIQEEKTTKVIDHMIKKERGIWKEMTDRFDPKGYWRKKYEDRAREKGIIIPTD